LLTHTSGISNQFYDQVNLRQDYTENDLVKKIAVAPLDFQPGQSWIYSNAGYHLVNGELKKLVRDRRPPVASR
jgi:CubicO group peptidase (beta-lactamase class C family)